MLIFLDFDGVLRRQTSPLYKLDPDCVARFESALLQCPRAHVVIASTWREAFSIGELRRHFSADIRLRIIGITPISNSSDDFSRHREVLAYLKRTGQKDKPWVAIDDDPLNYPAMANVILADASRGFDDELAARLVELCRREEQG